MTPPTEYLEQYVYTYMYMYRPYTRVCEIDILTYFQKAIYACRIKKSVANTKSVRKNLHISLAVNNQLAKGLS